MFKRTKQNERQSPGKQDNAETRPQEPELPSDDPIRHYEVQLKSGCTVRVRATEFDTHSGNLRLEIVKNIGWIWNQYYMPPQWDRDQDRRITAFFLKGEWASLVELDADHD